MESAKFRAWSIKEKRMIKWRELQFHNLRNVLNKPEKCGLKLMQYTGKRDTKQDEIYTGDIFEIDEGLSGQVYVIEWKLGGFQVFMYSDKFKRLSEFYINEIDTSCVRIIGNIYENPELIS